MSLVTDLQFQRAEIQLAIDQWELPDHGVCALVGPSGSGKTTVVQILAGLVPCPSMSWKWGELNLAELPMAQKRLGVVFQSLELFPHMTCKENIAFAAEVRGVSEPSRKVERWLERLELVNCQHRRPHQLSGGEAQRVALARAIIGEPRFLFLDEAFSSLDLELKEKTRRMVLEVVLEEKVPTLMISHDPEDIRDLAQTVFFLEKGKIKA